MWCTFVCQTRVQHLWNLPPPPKKKKLLSKPRQTLVFKHHLNNDIFFLQQFDRVLQWQYLEQRLLSWDTFLRGSRLPTSILSLQNDITCCIINLPPHPLLVIVSSDHKYSQQRTSYQTGKSQNPLENWVISNKCKHLDLMYCRVETLHCQLLN